MTRRAPLLLLALLAAPAFAGCAAPPSGDGGHDDGDGDHGHGARSPGAPWWELGQWWSMRVARDDGSESFRLVTFRNDTEHFWLGVRDRDQALAHALWGTNPFLGRIHHDLLAPHESGRHAVMYRFPLADGATWDGFLLGRTWTFHALEGQGGHFTIEGVAAGGETVRYDYDPRTSWFTHLEERDARGALVWQALVTDSGRDATGAYVFLRGRDYHRSGGIAGTRDQSFTVDEELDSLALHAGVRSQGALNIRVTDPDGGLAHQWTLGPSGGAVNETVEVTPRQGVWRVEVLSPGGFEGRVYVTGLLEATGAV